MAWPIEKDVVMGQLALAIGLEQLKLQVGKGELTDEEVDSIVTKALAKFPPEFQPQLKALIEG